MLFVIMVVGFVGAAVLGIAGLAQGSDAGQMERIFAIALFALGAAGLVGHQARTVGLKPPRARRAVTFGDIVQAIIAAPIVALMFGVFLLTLVPSVYVSLPVFAMRRLGDRRPRRRQPRAEREPLPEPAIA